jgi:hypothetical protein
LPGGFRACRSRHLRVREKLAFLPAQYDAVGRTSQISGSATFTQASSSVAIRAAKFDVDVNTLKSDREMRDEKIKEIGPESDRYPSSGTVKAVGSLTFPWSEFGMTAPSVAGFVNLTEHATMEFELQLARS